MTIYNMVTNKNRLGYNIIIGVKSMFDQTLFLQREQKPANCLLQSQVD